MSSKTLAGPLGGETYQEIEDTDGNVVILTYNDLWMMLVCQTTLDGDWVRTRQAAMMVADAARKRMVIDRLWQLEQVKGGLPPIPAEIRTMHLERAHHWFKKRPVLSDKNW
ncbi:MAG: hypothetical protein H6671_01010 [Anaerolineaceae bacterium]|nr:hypothetical protein [Anaerolineaceae bacterium]